MVTPAVNPLQSSFFTTENIILYGLLSAFITLMTLVLYLASRDNGNSMATTLFYSAIIIVPFIAMAAFFLLRGKETSTVVTNTSYYLLGFITVAVIIYFFTTMDVNTVLRFANFANLLLTLIVLVGIAIGFYYYGSMLKTSPSISKSTRFWIYFIFYIPCLFIDFATWIVNEFRLTSKPVYILFLMEAVFVTLYFLIPKFVNSITTQNSIVLLPGIKWLDTRKVLADSNMLEDTSGGPGGSAGEDMLFRKNYAISMWIFLNNQPPNFAAYDRESNIFNYANGAPRVTYVRQKSDRSEDTHKDSIMVYATNSSNDVSNAVALDINKQKWNNIVFNYHSNSVDIFVNGNLEKTVDLSKSMPQYSPHDTIVIGEEGGLYGTLCNVVYHKAPLSELTIVNSYNYFANTNPPTNNM